MRFLSRRTASPALVALVVMTIPALANADWPSSPTVNLPVCVTANLQTNPNIITDQAGGAFIFWQDQRSGVDYDIYVQRVLASGVVAPGWPVNGRPVCAVTGAQVNARSVSDGAGGAIVMWLDNRSGVSADLYAHHVLANGSLDPAWPADGLAVCTLAGTQSPANAVSDLAGGAVLAWRDTRNDSDLYAARVLPSGMLDPTWPAGGAAIVAGPGGLAQPVILADGQGGLFAAWWDTRNAPAQEIYAQHMLANGSIAPGWPSSGVPLCTASGTRQIPSLTSDGAGGVIVGWEDLRLPGNSDIYAQRVRANGTLDPAWPSDGRAVCVATGNQTRAIVLSDDAGGAFVGWTDARAGAIPALYAQHLLSNGTLDPAWPVGDLGFCLAFGSHINLTLLPDGYGGALAVWDDSRSGLHIYAHHLLVNGTVDAAWPLNGRAVCTATGTQNANSAAIPDGSGGFIVAWSDTRTTVTTSNDIYAQRVQANGTLGGTVVDVPLSNSAAFSLATLAPTPSRHGRLGLRFTLPREGPVSVELLDVAGRRVASRDLGSLSAGPQTLDWPVGAKVAPGLHLVRLRFGTESRTVKAIVTE